MIFFLAVILWYFDFNQKLNKIDCTTRIKYHGTNAFSQENGGNKTIDPQVITTTINHLVTQNQPTKGSSPHLIFNGSVIAKKQFHFECHFPIKFVDMSKHLSHLTATIYSLIPINWIVIQLSSDNHFIKK